MKKIGLIIKEESEKAIKNRLQDTDAFFLVKYSGISATDLTGLRNSLREIDSSLMVLKNSVSRRVFKPYEELNSFIKGPCGLIIVNKDLIATSKMLHSFAKEKPQGLEIKVGFLKDRIISDKEIESLSKIPSLAVLHGKVVTGLKAPIFSFVSSMKQILNKLVWVLASIKEKKEKSK